MPQWSNSLASLSLDWCNTSTKLPSEARNSNQTFDSCADNVCTILPDSSGNIFPIATYQDALDNNSLPVFGEWQPIANTSWNGVEEQGLQDYTLPATFAFEGTNDESCSILIAPLGRCWNSLNATEHSLHIEGSLSEGSPQNSGGLSGAEKCRSSLLKWEHLTPSQFEHHKWPKGSKIKNKTGCRKGPLAPMAKKKAHTMRKLRACLPCWISKVPVG